MTPVVLDASAGVEILLLTPVGRRLLAKLPNDAEEWVPELFFAEVAAVLNHDDVRARSSPTRLALALHRLRTAPLRQVKVRALLPEARSTRQSLTVADAVYVVMARRLGAPLVTTDKRLAAVAGLSVSTLVS